MRPVTPGFQWARTCPNSMLDLPVRNAGRATPEPEPSALSRPSQLPVGAGPAHAGGVASTFDLPAAPAGTAAPDRAPSWSPFPRGPRPRRGGIPCP